MNSFELTLYRIGGYLSENWWGRCSSAFQLAVSARIARLYETRLSRHLVRPYCWWQYGDAGYADRYLPGSGAETYQSFQDFFVRELPAPPTLTSPHVWPCEGYVAEVGPVGRLPLVRVKGQLRPLRDVFGAAGPEIPDGHTFANVFLHNNNYHHIHAPVDGVVTRIERVPGELLLLRPWAYERYPSLPAITNERVNVDVRDAEGRTWYLSIVGGPVVATIKVAPGITVGASVRAAQKLATFELGSTCCMAGPVPVRARVGESVSMGDPL